MIKEIMKAVSIPVMAKVRVGHFVEAQILESLGVDCIDESEVLTPADSKRQQRQWVTDERFLDRRHKMIEKVTATSNARLLVVHGWSYPPHMHLLPPSPSTSLRHLPLSSHLLSLPFAIALGTLFNPR
jgi:hypothetical protein